MSRHATGVNVLFADGSVHFGLPDLARVLRSAPPGIGAVALGPQVPALEATLTALRRHGVPVGLPRQQAFDGAYSALLLLPPPEPGGETPAAPATGIGFIGVPGGPVKFPSSLLLPAVQKVREAAARMPMKFEMRLVMVQDTAASGPQESMALNFQHIRY